MAKPPDDVGWKARAFCGSHRSVLPKRFLTVIGDSLIGFKNILQDKPVEKDWNESILLQVVFFFSLQYLQSFPQNPGGSGVAWHEPSETVDQHPGKEMSSVQCSSSVGRQWENHDVLHS